MKKFLSLLTLSLIISIGVINAQNQRTVVLECFTSTTCGPCASANPALDNLINNNADKLIAIKYHVNWPAAGDPMNLHNPGDVSSKVSFYSINAVPYSVGDGTWVGNSSSVSQAMINQWAAVDSPIDMRMTHYFNAAQDTMFVVVMGRASSAINSNSLKLNISVIEKTMEYASAPGSNGERIFHNVMKKLLPSAAGTSIAAMEAGDYFAYKYSWALANVMNVSELTAVAWLQDGTTKQMIQGCKSSDDVQPFIAKQAKISKLDHTKKTICSSSVNPDIYVTNFGSETINSLAVNVSVNGTSIADLTWQGNIDFGKTAKINFGELNFADVETLENNEMIFEITQINGAADEYAPGTYRYAFEEAPVVVNKTLKLSIRTDDEPQNITWDIVKTSNGEVVVSGGPYEEPHKVYSENIELVDDDCYMFTIYDAGGNGMAGGNGLYGIKVGSQTIISGNDFTDKESNEFYFTKNDGVAENIGNDAHIYPNPSNGFITVDVEGMNVLTVYNTTGQMVYNQSINDKTTVDLSKLEKGTYLMVLTTKDGKNTKQVIVLQ
ncbi:MAG: T9SS type A sorting domain-containing protein [Bacteroidales bacterium]|nr:T9SS type A sorting domain-containing protein [Bacteroidales bacterium]